MRSQVQPGGLPDVSQYGRVPLKCVAADAEWYSGKSFVLEASAAADLVFTGTIDQAEVSDWLRALQSSFPLEVSTPPDGPVLVRSRH